MKNQNLLAFALVLIFISQLLMSFGYDFLMSQQPIDFAHWSLLIASIMMLALWNVLPPHFFKKIGLSLMTLGVAGTIGMCTLDILLWAAHHQPETKGAILHIINGTPSLQFPFLIVGPALFYSGICISTYGLFSQLKWQVVLVNLGGLMIGLGHMVLKNHNWPAVGALILMIGMSAIILKE